MLLDMSNECPSEILHVLKVLINLLFIASVNLQIITVPSLRESHFILRELQLNCELMGTRDACAELLEASTEELILVNHDLGVISPSSGRSIVSLLSYLEYSLLLVFLCDLKFE
jgi:hypothetical protein